MALLNATLALIGLTIGAFYVYSLSKNVLWGWFSFLAANLLNFTFGTSQSAVGGLNLALLDLIYMSLLVAGVIRTVPRLRERSTPLLISLGYLAVIFFSYVRGIITYGFPAASNGCRGYIATFVAMLYFLTAPVDDESLRKYLRLYLMYGAGLLVVAVLAQAGLPVGALAWAHGQGEAAINGRLLPSGAAAGVAICVLLSLGFNALSEKRTLLTQFGPPLFLGLVILLRHRTVWIMLIACFTAILFLNTRLLRRFVGTFVILGMLGTVGFLLTPKDERQQQTALFSDASENQGTFLWRLHSWEQVLSDEDQSLFTIAFGESMGAGYWRFIPELGTYADIPPHSEYVSQYSRIGVVGLPFLFLFLLRPIFVLWRYSKSRRFFVFPILSIWPAVVIAAVAYGFTYSIETDVYAMVAFANAITVRIRQEQAERVKLSLGASQWKPRMLPTFSQKSTEGDPA